MSDCFVCAACRERFASVEAFDLHRRYNKCVIRTDLLIRTRDLMWKIKNDSHPGK